MDYNEPKQWRSQQTERVFLDALDECLKNGSFQTITIADIADQAGLTQSAFLARFGSKDVALKRVFDRFCDDVYESLDRSFTAAAVASGDIRSCLRELSVTYERLVKKHWGANYAMHELFLKEGMIDDQTKEIFKATTVMLERLLERLGHAKVSTAAIFATTQLLVTINYNAVLGAMPGLPKDDDCFQTLIAGLLHEALTNEAFDLFG